MGNPHAACVPDTLSFLPDHLKLPALNSGSRAVRKWPGRPT